MEGKSFFLLLVILAASFGCTESDTGDRLWPIEVTNNLNRDVSVNIGFDGVHDDKDFLRVPAHATLTSHRTYIAGLPLQFPVLDGAGKIIGCVKFLTIDGKLNHLYSGAFHIAVDSSCLGIAPQTFGEGGDATLELRTDTARRPK